jgi:pimeloyl-ACP methyl ester carboxylesterase
MSDTGIERNRLARLQAREIVVDGLCMFFRASLSKVPDERPPVVLVHGLVVASDYMLPTAERLAVHFPVYAPDLPGFGRSAKPSRAFDIIELADVLAAWIRALGLGRAVLLANSFGCQVVAECAVRHPDVVETPGAPGPYNRSGGAHSPRPARALATELVIRTAHVADHASRLLAGGHTTGDQYRPVLIS